MRILHFCAGCHYIENMEYQENALPRKHKAQGHEVKILCNRFTFTPEGKRGYREAGAYVNADGIEVTVLPYKNTKFAVNLNTLDHVYESISAFAPDIVFIHGPQSGCMPDVVRYKKRHPEVKIFADSHADYVNTDVSLPRHMFIQRHVFGRWVRMIAKIAERVWGVTPQRVRYLEHVYGVPHDKTGLLVMGGDESKIDFAHRDEVRKRIRAENGIDGGDFLVVAGGKIDEKKNFHLLAEAVESVGDEGVKLALFGMPSPEMKERIDGINDERIVKIGWISSDEAYNWFLAGDVAVFPGTHSVLWEQAAAAGIPMVVKHWDGMEHIDVGGNALFLEKDSADEIKEVLEKLHGDKKLFEEMTQAARTKAVKEFSYSEIALRSIGLE